MEGAGGSPTGSQTQVDGAQIAFRMVQVAEAAAAAASAVANRPDNSKDDWYKMLPKPGVFDPRDREAEPSSFRDWWWSVEQYLMAVDIEYINHFDVLRKNLDTAINDFFDLSVCSDFSKLSVNVISEVFETCDCDLDFHSRRDLFEPGGDDIIGTHHGSIGLGDLRLPVTSYYDECSQDSTVAYTDDCMCSSTNNIEFISCSPMTSCCEYELCTLCKLDDFEHFSSIVSMDGAFSMYERVLPQHGARSLIRRFDESCHFKLNCCSEDAFDEFALDVRAVRSCCDIILDSGSDATVIPVGMISAGSPSIDQSSFLRDGQGSRIETEGVRDVSGKLTRA